MGVQLFTQNKNKNYPKTGGPHLEWHRLMEVCDWNLLKSPLKLWDEPHCGWFCRGKWQETNGNHGFLPSHIWFQLTLFRQIVVPELGRLTNIHWDDPPITYIYTHRWAFKKPKCRTYICGLVKWNGHGDDKYEWNQHRFEWDNHQNFMFFEITPAFFLRWTNSAQNNHVETQTTANKTKTLCNPFPLGYWSFPAIARLQ